ncbi:tRNA (N(6)-L-threonylcarbamoyladenosine(37)-C(2))-methylthiotransferase MtaB [Helicobacter sp. MIT 05-5293]|uniref:tRNA (N(6)-L-threonylcarbamoyladenosine(37)-C(2))- methylthiotransferase MtaB n=1 Tax=Helicobacter sp. MIT 05-5293 TaxID=1548149 RepID=UPI00051CC369|nr:tRNA (N(6)-L-threonylcarbamoyladenosine(37)-C(2))-methylthiotransferase MtaB [Helicobacter sp. MIT 05-5293]TLD81566.1 tRNA (N(6)-L-threonylcarbamoyladenosine(37)-C(2))-methylthiotransferase MtaB [Helicobacter sp. MIT 05-5293]
MAKVFFKTFGCRTNLFDTQVMKSSLRHFECTENEEEADIIVVNSCTVTNGADSGVRSYLSKMRQGNKKIYFTGCGVGTRGESIFHQGLAYGVFAHSFKEQIDDFLSKKESFFYPETNPEHRDKTLITQFLGKSRAFLKIQEGCDFACNYCIIPSVRGKARSIEKQKILEQIAYLAESGISEVVLTGTNVGSYGKEFVNENLARLIKDIAKQNCIKRLRVGSLEPSQIDEEFLECLDLPLFERHLHIALQHTSDTMLAIMNRPNRVKSDLRLFERIARKGFCLGSDLIVGHPGEDEKVWEEAWANFQAFPLTHLHIFVYSPRDGTPSASMKNTIKGDVAKQRLHQLKSFVSQNNMRFRQTHKVPLEVLCESRTESESSFVYSGLDQFFNRVRIATNRDDLEGQWIDIDTYEIKQEGNDAKI